MDKKLYFVYVIKESGSGSMYVGCSNSTNEYYNPLKFLVRKAKTSMTEHPEEKHLHLYQKLLNSVNNNKYKNHVFYKTKFRNLEKEAAEEKVFQILSGMSDEMVLNDKIVNPERYVCESCGKKLKLVFKEVHEAKYCSKAVDNLLDEYISSRIEKKVL